VKTAIFRHGGLAAVAKSRCSELYDLYWRFAAERQLIFFRRLEGRKPPWTSDSILGRYRFTNVYRASDKVSQFLIRHVIYNEDYPSDPKEVVFRILLFKFFNKISTWELLTEQLGTPTWQSFSRSNYERILGAATANGARLYSAAYVIPPVALDDTSVKYRGHLALLELIIRSDFVERVQQTRMLSEVFQFLISYPSLGRFLALQLAIDINYSGLIDHDEARFVVAGPGAHDGLSKVFPQASNADAEGLIEMMMDVQDSEFDRLGIEFRSLWGRSLQLIDCQNIFCELSKYTRVSHPDIMGISGRTRIKQIFRPAGPPSQPWYPPKWKINGRIPTYAATGIPRKLGDIR